MKMITGIYFMGLGVLLLQLTLTEGNPTHDWCRMGTYAPNPQNCSTFFQCVNGRFRERPCPPGLFWNQRILVCDWPYNVDCNCTDNGGPGNTTERCKDGDFKAHPTDCGSFYRCSNGAFVLLHCPDGLWWNSTSEVCDWPENCECVPGGNNSTTTPRTNTTTTTTTTTTPKTTTTSTTIRTTTKHHDGTGISIDLGLGLSADIGSHDAAINNEENNDEETKPTEKDEETKPTEKNEETKPIEKDEETKPTEKDEETKPTEKDEETKPTEKDEETKPTEKSTPKDEAETEKNLLGELLNLDYNDYSVVEDGEGLTAPSWWN